MRLASWQFRDGGARAGRGMINAGARAEGPGRRPITTVDIDRALLRLYRRGVIGDAR